MAHKGTREVESTASETVETVKTAKYRHTPEILGQDLRFRLSSGVPELDEILSGGFLPRRAFVVRGNPGCGKSTLGLHFLTEGAVRGEATLYITVGEPEEQIRNDAAILGLDLTNVAFLDLSRQAEFLSEMEQFLAPHVEEQQHVSITELIIRQIKTLKPQRIFLDSMTQLRLISPDTFQLRRQVLAFLHFLIEQEATVLVTSESGEDPSDTDLQVVSDGVINLHSGAHGRSLQVTKFRGSAFRDGSHAMRLGDKGLQVYPRLIPEAFSREFKIETISSGVAELDEMLHGGVERGTITILTGPSGIGKTTLGLQMIKEAAVRGEHSIVYIFEEWAQTLIRRCEAVNIPIRSMIEHGTLTVKQIDPLSFRPDEFSAMVRQDVERKKTSMVMIDSVAGYRLSVRDDELVSNIHAVSKYLQNMGIAVLLINEVATITGEFRATEVGISYMADNLIFLRYMEKEGQMLRAIGVLKKRVTDFERTMRQIDISPYGIRIGKPLTQLRGILIGALTLAKPE